MAKFSEVLTIVNGRNQKQVVCDDGKYPIYGSGGIMGYANDYICKAETVVIGRKGSINKPIFVETPFWNVDTAFGLYANSEKLNSKYLYYFCEKFDFEKLNTTVTIPSLTKSNLLNVEIPLPNLEKQKQIVELLDKVTSLIFLRKQQLSKLDELVKARFVEMFGDPVVNSKRWPVETIENHIDLLTGFPFDSSGYVSKGVNICGGLIIMPQKIDWSACKHWPQITGYEDYILRPNDIVIALDRPWISNGFKIAMVDREHLPALLIQRTARIRAVDINQHYLMQSLLLGRFDKHCNITGSLVPHISPKDIKSYSVMLPPIELQNQFAAFVERVNQQKQTVQQSLEKLELMKKALMQEYFG
jgi:type I restriction enzyme, S subunit